MMQVRREHPCKNRVEEAEGGKEMKGSMEETPAHKTTIKNGVVR